MKSAYLDFTVLNLLATESPGSEVKLPAASCGASKIKT
jgi:hypothetical protein